MGQVLNHHLWALRLHFRNEAGRTRWKRLGKGKKTQKEIISGTQASTRKSVDPMNLVRRGRKDESSLTISNATKKKKR